MSRRLAQRGQHDQALGRSRGGFSTKIHLKTDFDGLPGVHPAVHDWVSVDADSHSAPEVDEERMTFDHLEVGVFFAHARIVELGGILRVSAEEDERFVKLGRLGVARDPVGASDAVRLG